METEEQRRGSIEPNNGNWGVSSRSVGDMLKHVFSLEASAIHRSNRKPLACLTLFIPAFLACI